MYSKGIVVGFLAKDPESRIVNDKMVCNFTVAVNNSKTDVCFMTVEAWDKRAEFVMKYFTKGKPIIAEGTLKQSVWEKDGKKFSKHLILAERVAFVGGQDRNSDGDQPGLSQLQNIQSPMMNESKRVATSTDAINRMFEDNLPF